MKARINAYEVTPEAGKAANELSRTIEAIGLEPSLVELVKIRASVINGCAFCINMHTRDARKAGESEARLYLVSVWRESTVFSPRERAALAYTDALTKVFEHGAPDAVFDELKAHFTDKEIVALTSAVAMINFYNRLAVGLGFVHPSEEARD